MEFEDDAYVLAARAHGETGAIVELLTAMHGRHVAHVAGGASRRMKPFLQDLGFGLDLSKCAATGSPDDLIYVSPRTGRAVSRGAGEPYKDKLLALPPFMLSAQGGLSDGDVGQGLDLTGHFLEAFVFAALNKPLPPARVWLIDRLREAGRL